MIILDFDLYHILQKEIIWQQSLNSVFWTTAIFIIAT